MRKNAIIGAVCLIVGVVLGALSGSWTERRRGEERTAVAVEAEAARCGRLEAELHQLRAKIDLTQVHLRLGRIALEGSRQDYGTAGEQATLLFGDLAQMAERTEGDERVRTALQQVLAARDEVIAGLATAQPAAVKRLEQLYLELFETAY